MAIEFNSIFCQLFKVLYDLKLIFIEPYKLLAIPNRSINDMTECNFVNVSKQANKLMPLNLFIYSCAVVIMAESLRCKVEEHLTCSVCLEPFKDPKVLPCLHSYCHQCIVNLAKNAKSKTIDCPECRLTVRVRDTNVV